MFFQNLEKEYKGALPALKDMQEKEWEDEYKKAKKEWENGYERLKSNHGHDQRDMVEARHGWSRFPEQVFAF